MGEAEDVVEDVGDAEDVVEADVECAESLPEHTLVLQKKNQTFKGLLIVPYIMAVIEIIFLKPTEF